ncbi:MAG TPA: transposase [Gemmataceae bacterium]|jgi:REP element-mobilizing transposase RayT|nr:transposase [Gemmataceae bacterium]
MPGHPIVIGHHIIWTCYGTWLPNDPRGSTSKTIRNDAIAELGELHFGRKKVQPLGRDIRAFYDSARQVLKHPLLTLDEASRSVVGRSIEAIIQCSRLTCWACAIMPDHVHILIRKHRLTFEEMMEQMKDASATVLRAAGHFPMDHPVWTAHGGWSVFLDHPTELRRTIPYIERNPDSYGLPRQTYTFVQPYDGWPLHPGHSPHSPYVKALKAVGRYP